MTGKGERSPDQGTGHGGSGGSDGFVVGVDGGGTGCRVVLMDPERRTVGEGKGQAALVRPDRPGEAARAVAGAVEAVVRDAGLTLPVRALWAGLAGAGRPGAREAEEIALRSLGLAGSVEVGTDVEAGHRDAFGTGAGVLLVVGTGSVAWGRDPEGRPVRVGGWGSVLGDEGSGYWLGREGLRAVARAADGRGRPTLLTPRLLEELGLPDPPALIPWMASASKGQVAALAPRVVEIARTGDPPAAGILQNALEELRRHLEVLREAWAPWGESFPLALSGGLLTAGGPLRELVEAVAREGGARLHPEEVVGARGAALLALEQLT